MGALELALQVELELGKDVARRAKGNTAELQKALWVKLCGWVLEDGHVAGPVEARVKTALSLIGDSEGILSIEVRCC